MPTEAPVLPVFDRHGNKLGLGYLEEGWLNVLDTHGDTEYQIPSSNIRYVSGVRYLNAPKKFYQEIK